MSDVEAKTIDLTPRRIKAKTARRRIRAFVRAVGQCGIKGEEAIEAIRSTHVAALSSLALRDRMPTEAAVNVFADLAKMGWNVSLRSNAIEGNPPIASDTDSVRATRRVQLAARRHEQLRLPSTREFIAKMEAGHIFNRQIVSVFSLMRDGRELASTLASYQLARREGRVGAPFVRPYLQFVDRAAMCKHTGFRLQDIWRYFRHTWSSSYESVPGRSLLVLIRDAAAPFHPIVGIAAVASAASVLPARDKGFIRWSGETFARECTEHPSNELATWAKEMVQRAIREIYRTDFIAEGLLPLRVSQKELPKVVKRLRRAGFTARERHIRQSEAREYKSGGRKRSRSEDDWESQARSDLFRSKRALELASLLAVQGVVNSAYEKRRGKDRIRTLCETQGGRDALTKILRIARSRTIGTAIADLNVCGSISPYNEILGGKLVAMLAVGPEVVREYKRRYRGSSSVIASSMAGHEIVRPANLVYVGTTSLYGTRPSQYDRIVIPAERLGGKVGDVLRYKYLGDTVGLGTTQFGYATRKSVEAFVRRSYNGVRRVNNVFGEGANPKLRALRDGIAGLGFSEDIMIHGLTKSVYGVCLIQNLRDYLLGISKRPKYLFPLMAKENRSDKIAEWWYERWVTSRCERQDIVERVLRHTLVRPVVHGARVSLPIIEGG